MDLLILGSSYNLPAHGSGGARARINNSAAKKSFCRSEDGSAGGGWGGVMPSRPSEYKRGQPRRLLVESRTQQKSFLFLFPSTLLRMVNLSNHKFFFDKEEF